MKPAVTQNTEQTLRDGSRTNPPPVGDAYDEEKTTLSNDPQQHSKQQQARPISPQNAPLILVLKPNPAAPTTTTTTTTATTTPLPLPRQEEEEDSDEEIKRLEDSLEALAILKDYTSPWPLDSDGTLVVSATANTAEGGGCAAMAMAMAMGPSATSVVGSAPSEVRYARATYVCMCALSRGVLFL